MELEWFKADGVFVPLDGSKVICKCPEWCELGYQIAIFVNGKFTYPEQSNDSFHDCVEWFAILDVE